MDGGRSIGTVKFYAGDKGYGFVRRHSDGLEIFFHCSQLPIGADGFYEAVSRGAAVSFEIAEERGRNAPRKLRLSARSSNSPAKPR